MILTTSIEPHLYSTSVVEDIHNHDDVIGLELSYMHNECFFTVLLSCELCQECKHSASTASGTSVIHNLISKFNEACTWTENDKSIEDVDRRLDEIWLEAESLARFAAFDKIRCLGRKYGREVRAGDTSGQKLETLAKYLFPTTFNLHLIPSCSGINVVCRPDLPQCLPFKSELGIPWTSELRSLAPTEVRILKWYRPHVLKVQVGDTIFCCKLNNAGSQNSFLREFETLQRICNSPLRGRIRVPHLRGVVVVNNGIIGLLMDWIETDEPDLMVLLKQKRSITESERSVWAAELSYALRQLHNLDITWGDAKTSNILIDLHHRPWIVDFGGGFTRGWVDEALHNTRAGDLQGLENTFLDIFGRR